MSHVIYIEDIPPEAIRDCSGPGSADAAVAHWVDKLQFSVPADDARRYLDGCGCWDDDELDDHAQNLQRVFWLACGTFAEFLRGGPDHGSDVVCLES